MTSTLDILDEASALARDMVQLAHDRLLTTYRFVHRPLAQLPFRTSMDVKNCATNAHELVFSPGFVLNTHQGAPHLLTRAYLHMVLHCLLRHPFPPQGVNMLRWSTACDLAVAALMQELEQPVISVADAERDAELVRMLAEVDQPTASAFYALFSAQQTGEDELMRLGVLFGLDSHELWLPGDDALDTQQVNSEQVRQLQERWEEVARKTEVDLQRDEASQNEALSTALSHLEAEPMGLEELLRQFSAPRERLEVNLDEFDYPYYAHGLATYGNIALIEPLEHRDDPEVRDFCIALDTSGSVSGPLVEQFIRRACGMLLEGTPFGTTTRVRIIQCDDRIQHEAVLTSTQEVSDYLESVEVKGHGGTDFRPVFEHVDTLVESGTVEDLAGVIYFTDGLGTFPEETPAYDAAFVFVNELHAVPPWATAVLTYTDELL